MLKEMDQRICIKISVKNEIKFNKVCEMLTKAYGESAMSKTRVYEWYKRFQDGREDVEDNERPGRPSTSTTDESVEKVKETIAESQSEMSLMMLAYRLAHVMKCFRMFCV